jgi:uncharacterized OB-fold protein
MPYLPNAMPAPLPSRDDAQFWSACNEGRLLIRHCTDCERFSHPPMPSCPHCASTRMDWKEVSGNGTVYTYTIGHHPTHPALKGHDPYNVAVVLLEDAGDVRLVSNVVDVAPEDMKIGLPVSVYWDAIAGGFQLPRFKKRIESNQTKGDEQ